MKKEVIWVIKIYFLSFLISGKEGDNLKSLNKRRI